MRQDKKEALQANQQKRIHSANTVDSVETGLSNGMFKAGSCQSSASFQMSASLAKASRAKCIKPVIAACTKIEDASFTEQKNGKRNKLAVLDFSGCEGAYMLPYEFRAKEIDEHQEQSYMAKQSLTSDEDQEPERAAERSIADEERPSGIHSGNPSEIYSGNPSQIYSGNPSDEARDPEKEEEALENYSEVEQCIVPVVQPSSPSNVFTKVHLADSLLNFRFGQNHIVDAPVSKILINFERPIEMSNLFVRNDLVTNHDSQHMVSFIEANSDNLSKPKLFLSCQLNFVFIWTTLFVSCLANIWSRMRRIFCNYFGCRNVKPGPKSFEADSKASGKEDENQCIAESDDAKPALLGCFVSELVSQYQLMDEQCTFSPGIVDHIVGASSTNPIIIDHDVEPSGQEQMQCLFEENIKDNNVIHQAAQSRRLKFVEARSYEQSDQIGFDGDQMLTRLSQADSSKGQQVHTNDDGVKSSSKDMVKKCINNNLEDGNSIKATMATSSTGGQQENSKTDARTVKESKGNGKHKGKKPKVTFAQLLEKYQKISEAKSAYRPSETKASKSPPRHKFEDKDWRRKMLSKQTPYPPFGPPMPMSWIPPPADYYSYQSWGKYKSRAHHPSYSKPPQQNYAAPRGSSFVQQPHAKDRLNQKVSVRS